MPDQLHKPKAGAFRPVRNNTIKRTQAGPRGKKGILPVLFAVLASLFMNVLPCALPARPAALTAVLPVHAEEEEPASAAESGTTDAAEPDAAAGSSLLIPETYIVGEDGIEDVNAEAEIRRTIAPESNDYGRTESSIAEGYAPWPEGPSVSAEAAVVIEASTGTVLYAKNMHEKLYPASTTKLLTALIAYEELPEDSLITVSQSAVDSVPWDGSNIGLDAGEYLGLEDMIYGVMVASANEGANALGEAVSGSADAFAEKMNAYAASLGCVDSHFVTASGLHRNDHYTSAYDMALIGRQYFSHEFLARVAGTAHYHIPPAAGQPDDIWINSTNWFSLGEVNCTGFVGGKTGYTDHARSCLVTCAEKNGVRLICAVLREEPPSQYNDTAALMDYGFNMFRIMSLSDILDSVQSQELESMADGVNGADGIRNLPSARALAAGRFSLVPEGTLVLTADQSFSSIICTPQSVSADAAAADGSASSSNSANTNSNSTGSAGSAAGGSNLRIGELVFTANGSSARAYIEYAPLTATDLGFSNALSGEALSAPVGKKTDTALSAPVSAVRSVIDRLVGFFVKSVGNVTYVHVPHILEVLAALLGFFLLILLIRRILGSFHFGRRVY